MNIQRLKAVSERHMPSVLKVTRYVYPVDEQGRPLTDRWGDPLEPTPHTTTTKCKLRSTSGDEAIVAGQLQESAEVLIKAPVGTDIRSSDQMRVDGVLYNIKAVEPRSSDQAADVKIQASRASDQG